MAAPLVGRFKGVVTQRRHRRPASLADVFDMWGVYLSPKCLGGYCGGVKMWVNGKPSTAFGKLVLQPHMAITLLEGTPPKGFKPAKSYNFPAGL